MTAPTQKRKPHDDNLYHKIHIYSQLYETLRAFIEAAKWCIITWFIYLSIKELAGHTTVASFLLQYISSDKPEEKSVVIWQLVSFVIFMWALAERWLRFRKVRRLSDRITELEKVIDPQRSSSSLTKEGKTNPEDKLP